MVHHHHHHLRTPLLSRKKNKKQSMDGRCIRPLANVFSFSFSSREYLFPSTLRRQKQAACHDLKRWLACVGLPSKLVSLVFSCGRVWLHVKSNLHKKNECVHGVLNEIYLQNFFKDGLTFRDESNDVD